jgi:peptidoglycan L-alanyl-D-glutamate endopeptidase CwlK
MYYFSKDSKNKLSMAHWILAEIAKRAILILDIKVITTHRCKAEQNKAFQSGASKLEFPKSGHNGLPSKALDAMPYPVVWADKVSGKEKESAQSRVMFMAGIFFGIFADMQELARFRLAEQSKGRLTLTESDLKKDIEILKYKLRWGHDWDGDRDFFNSKFIDSPHFELAPV